MRQQIVYMLTAIISVPFLPFLYFLGKKVRKSIPDLPESPGPMSGTIEGSNDTKKTLVCLGESSVAGVGISSHEKGFTGQIAQNLARNTSCTIRWSVIAKSGYTASKVHQHLVSQLPASPIDYIVIGLGGNDTFQLNSPWTWYKSMRKLIASIRTTHKSSKILIANMPPVGAFPAFPKVLRWLFDGLITLHGQMAYRLPHEFPDLKYANEKINLDNWADRLPDGRDFNDFFSDGVHPSELTYTVWGKQLAQEIVEW